MGTAERTHAVVVGGSIAGLLAARVLAEAYSRVTVAERDDALEGAEARRGVPQGNHIHALLSRGVDALEELMPGFGEALCAAGGLRGDAHAQARYYLGGHRLRQRPSRMRALAATRPFLEARIRAQVGELPNVTFVTGTRVLDLEMAPAGPSAGRVSGVRIHGPSGGTETLAADLVVDASGRGSKLPAWLAAHGYAASAEDEIRVDVGYASRLFRLAPGALGGDLAVIIGATPDRPRGGVVQVVEGGRAIVTLSGYLGDHPPLDDAGFLAFADRLPRPEIAHILRDAEPLTPISQSRHRSNVRRRFEALRRFPDGLLAVGDAICAFNPLYAQGMTVAALQALALRDCLAEGSRRPLFRRFFRRAARIVDPAWEIVVGGDLRIPGVEGRRTGKVRLVNAWLRRVHAAGATDAEVAARFFAVANLCAPPPSLLSPAVVLRVLRAERRSGPAPDALVAASG